MDWLGRSMQCHFVTEITEKSCVDAQFSNKNYKEQTVNIPPNVVIEAYTCKASKSSQAGMKGTQIDIQCTSIVHLPNQICLPPLSLYLGAYVSESLHLSIVVDAYGHIETNERTTDWLNVHFHAFHVWKTLFQLVYNHCQCKSAFRIAFAEICAR